MTRAATQRKAWMPTVEEPRSIPGFLDTGGSGFPALMFLSLFRRTHVFVPPPIGLTVGTTKEVLANGGIGLTGLHR